MKSLILCVKQTQLLLCGLNSGPNKDVSRMKAVAAENTEHTAGFSSHSHCVVLAPLLHTRTTGYLGFESQFSIPDKRR